MGRYILCGEEAAVPYEVEELDLRIFTIEELCYYIYHNLPLIGDDFIDERLKDFIRSELKLPEIADKIERFYNSVSDQDATIQMLLTEVGYYTESEMLLFQQELVRKRRKSGPERVRLKADSLYEKKRYESALRIYRTLINEASDGRITSAAYAEILESMANAYGHLCAFEKAFECLEKAYRETKSERILRKMYDTVMIAGMELPEQYFSKVPDEVLNQWQQDYWSMETLVKSRMPENESMQMFLHEPAVMKKEMKRYTAEKKEEYRFMME